MKDKDELIKEMESSQDRFDKLIRRLGQGREKIMEARIKVKNDKIKLKELYEILDKIIASLSPKVEQEIQDIIEELYGLQGEIARE